MANEPVKPSPSDEKVLELSNLIAALTVEIETLKKAGNSKDDISALKTELNTLKSELASYKTLAKVTKSAEPIEDNQAGFWNFNE